MDTLVVDKLFKVLEKETHVYRGLQEISNKKTDVIVEGKVSELENLVKLEQSLVVQIGKLEEVREELLGRISKELDIAPSDITISELAKHVEGSWAEKLKSCQSEMVDTLNKLKNTNELNSKLIKNSLEYIDFSINLVAAADSAGNNYGNSGQVSDSKKRNFFDARL